VEILSGIISIDELPYQKIFGFYKIGIKLPALNYQPCLFKSNAFRTQFNGFQAGPGYLVRVLPRMGATKIKNIPVLFIQKTEGIKGMLLRKLKRKTLRPDKADRDGFIPEYAQGSPAGSHGIELCHSPCRDKHPVAVEPAEKIILQRFCADGFKQGCHYDILFAANVWFLQSGKTINQTLSKKAEINIVNSVFLLI
jgi:hypothetical protein